MRPFSLHRALRHTEVLGDFVHGKASEVRRETISACRASIDSRRVIALSSASASSIDIVLSVEVSLVKLSIDTLAGRLPRFIACWPRPWSMSTCAATCQELRRLTCSPNDFCNSTKRSRPATVRSVSAAGRVMSARVSGCRIHNPG